MRGPETNSVTNMDGEKVYESGPSAPKCTTGTNSKYPGLCSPDEKYTKQLNITTENDHLNQLLSDEALLLSLHSF